MVQTIFMHPFYGGEAVYMARALLHLNIEDELPPLRRHLQNKPVTKLVSTVLYIQFIPNPANDVVTLRSNIEFKNAKLKLVNVFGALIKEYILPETEKEFTFPVKELINGIYSGIIETPYQESITVKLVITR